MPWVWMPQSSTQRMAEAGRQVFQKRQSPEKAARLGPARRAWGPPGGRASAGMNGSQFVWPNPVAPPGPTGQRAATKAARK